MFIIVTVVLNVCFNLFTIFLKVYIFCFITPRLINGDDYWWYILEHYQKQYWITCWLKLILNAMIYFFTKAFLHGSKYYLICVFSDHGFIYILPNQNNPVLSRFYLIIWAMKVWYGGFKSFPLFCSKLFF